MRMRWVTIVADGGGSRYLRNVDLAWTKLVELGLEVGELDVLRNVSDKQVHIFLQPTIFGN